ncbi:MAG: hypothetical protein ACJ73E_15030 [Mycobacteriales bacterium]
MTDQQAATRTARGWRPYFWVTFAVTVLLSPVTVIWTALVGSVGLVVVLLASKLRPAGRQRGLVAFLAGLALGSVPYLLLAAVVAIVD